jgi:hypothetical protein
MAGIDLGLRVVVPLVSGLLAYKAAYKPCVTEGTDPADCGWFPTGTIEGFVAAYVAAGVVSIVDAAALSWEPRNPEPVPAARRSGVQWAPTAIAVRGGAVAGIGGRF